MNKNFKKKPFSGGNNRPKFNNGPKPSSFAKYITYDKSTIDQVTLDNEGANLELMGLIDQIAQTGGPTIFTLTDGTGSLALKAFDGAGVRAYPELNIGDAVSVDVTIQDYQGELEGELQKVRKLDASQKEYMLKKIAELQREKAKVPEMNFLVKDPILDKLKDRFVKAATEIRLAIIQNRPIVIRHHNDADGYSSGYSLERAILPLVSKQHNSIKAAWEFYTRSPIAAPMYELEDSIRDTAKSLSNAAKFSNKMPLVLIVDTGSGEKDLLGIQQGRVHGIDFIVVDHHGFDTDLISAETLVHINPFLVNETGDKFSAGMLCTELARFINQDPNLNIIQIPAMAGIADRTENPETMKAYLKLAETKGYTKLLLGDIAGVIDFISAKLRFMEAREYIEVLFGEPMKKQKALVELLSPYIKKLDEKGLEIAKSASKIEKVKDHSLQILPIETTFARGFYPKPGRCISLLHDYQLEQKKMSKLISIGLMNDAITIRVSEDSPFSVNEFVDFLETELSESFPEGGGHKHAGSIRFLPSKQSDVLNVLRDYIKKL